MKISFIKITIGLILNFIFSFNSYASKIILGTADFNPTDVTTIIQTAFNSTVDTVIVENVGQPWVVQPLFITRDNLTVIFEQGMILQAKSGAFPVGKQLLKVSDKHIHRVKNVNLIGYGAFFQMIKSEYNENENRHCLQIEWCENIKVFGLTFKDSGGDGILIQRSYYGDPCLNVHIKDCVADNNRRQGISVISAIDLLIENCEFKDTYGTSPMAGIDLEPDPRTVDLTKQVLKNIVVKNCRFTNNGQNLNSSSGISVALHQPNALLEPVSIRFENCYVTGIRGISIYTSSDVTGLIEFKQCLVENTSEVGISIHNPAYAGVNNLGANPNLAFVKFKECVFRNMASNYDHPIQVVGQLWNDASTNLSEYGGVEFTDCVLESARNRAFLKTINGFPESLGAANIKGNISIVNTIANGANLNLDVNSHDIGLAVTHFNTSLNVTASIDANAPNASEFNQTEGEFTISRTTSQPSVASAINYQLLGTATQMQDYNLSNGFVIIPPNQTFTTIKFLPLIDGISEPSESIIANLITDSRPVGIAASYSIGNPDQATMYIDVIVLPITYNTFTARKLNNTNLIFWQTSTEANNSFFELERSLDGLNFSIINTQSSKGNTKNLINYSFTDKDVKASTVYYRLKQTNFDGKFTYSKTISLKANFESNLNVYPNPFTSTINLSASKIIASLKIIGVNGQTIISKKLNKINYVLNIDDVTNGLYILEVLYIDGNKENIKLLKE